MGDDKLASWGRIAASVLAGIAFFAALVTAYISDDKQSLAILEGMGGSAFIAAINYWLGSSSGSTKKDQVIADQSAKKDEIIAASTTSGQQKPFI